MDPGLRGDDLLLDAGQQPLALGQGQAQAGQIGEVIGPGDPHDIGAVFFALSSEAHQLHDPDHVVSTSPGKRARRYPLRPRTPNLAAVPWRCARPAWSRSAGPSLPAAPCAAAADASAYPPR